MRVHAVHRVGPPAFSLMEMVVVIGLVALMASLALPSIMALYNAGADAQAYNLIAAQLTAARALAIEKATYAGVHVQLADARDGARLLRPDLENICYSAIVLYSGRKKQFNLYGQPRRLPGSMAFGSYPYQDAQGTRFTTFTVVFTPRGSLTKRVQGSRVRFNPDDPIFSVADDDPNALTGSQRLWQHEDANGMYAATALVIFDMGDYLGATDRSAYLKANGRILPINVHTGQLFPTE